MLALRLKRIGKKHQAAFRVVVGERRSKLKGDYTEDLGWYNPHSKKMEVKADRVKYWIGVGAKASDTVHNLLVAHKVIDGKKIPSHKQSKKDATTTEEKPVTAPVVGEAKAKEEAPSAEPATEVAAPAEVEKPAEQAA